MLQSPSHIVPVIVGDARLCKTVTDKLLEEHRVYVQPINYPTVPRGTERLRLTPGPLHTPDLQERLRESLLAVWRDVGLPLHAGVGAAAHAAVHAPAPLPTRAAVHAAPPPTLARDVHARA